MWRQQQSLRVHRDFIIDQCVHIGIGWLVIMQIFQIVFWCMLVF